MINKVNIKKAWKKPRLVVLDISRKTNQGDNNGYDGETTFAGGGGS